MVIATLRLCSQRLGSQGFGSQGFGSVVLLAMVLLLFVVLRLPTTLLSAGGQDEEWYGVPGMTVAREGIPRVPYARVSDADPSAADGVFVGADELLFAQPPLSFYAQAPFFLVFRGDYGTARLASFVAALGSIVLTFAIAEVFFHDRRISILAATLYSCSRLCFFPAMVARPDMICGTLGLAAVWMMAKWSDSLKRRWWCGAGVAVGLAALSHPFAIVFGIQSTIWITMKSGRARDRIGRVIGMAVVVATTFALWSPLIAMRPDLFRSQFVANILRPAGPGLISRFVMPWESLSHQVPQLIDRAHPIQFAMMAVGMIGALAIAYRRRDRAAMAIGLLSITSVYLLTACLGDHPIQGFWCYSASLGWIGFAYVAVTMDSRWIAGRWHSTGLRTIGIAVVFLAMLPGSGMRAVATFANKFGDPVYSNPQFVDVVLGDLPASASLTVGPEFSLPVLAQRDDVILACRHPMYFDSADHPTDFYLFGRRDFAEGMVEAYDCEFVRSYGHRDDDFANYAELYRMR